MAIASTLCLLSANAANAATVTLADVVPVTGGGAASAGASFSFSFTGGVLDSFSGLVLIDDGVPPPAVIPVNVTGIATSFMANATGGGALLLSGDLLDVAVTPPSTVELLFSKTGGSYAGAFGGDYLIMTLTAASGSFTPGMTGTFSGTMTLTGAELAAVPLPAGGALLAGALTLLAVRRRQQA
ncbi:hypothetical protein [Mangrovicoccus ximenensis]|uniref:hypothetical protein n=1 Tax=Mangrovicoccus ximenensis TaxID=1911570 RepID=UPI0011AE813C|nr:hypothetical protein [Mangrovicoccus ximenensis]